jgi:hypothetical protein
MRRHLIGLGLAVAMILVMFFAGSWGYVRLLRLPTAAGAPLTALPAHGGSLLSNTSVLTALGAVAVTGLFAGVLVALPRISPLAAGLPGLLAVAWTALYLANVKTAVQLIPLRSQAFGAGWEGLLFNGILGLAGLALLVPMFLPSRWRNPDADADAEVEADVTNAQDYVADLKSTLVTASAISSRRVSTPPLPSRPKPAAGQPGLTGPQPRLTGSQPRITGAQPRLTGGQPLLTGGQPRLTGGQPRLTGGQPRLTGAQSRATGAQSRLTGSQARLTGAQPTSMTGGQHRLTGGQPRLTGAQPTATGAQPSATGTQSSATGAQPSTPKRRSRPPWER